LEQWHSPYAVDYKTQTRLAHVFEEFMALILYEPITFGLRSDHFLLLGNGNRKLAIRYEWLDTEDRRTLVQTIFQKRDYLFKSQYINEHQHIRMDDCVLNQKRVLSPVHRRYNYRDSIDGIFSFEWQRQIVRDFVWMVFNQARKNKQPTLQQELHYALSSLTQMHPMGQCDLFLSRLLMGVEGRIQLYRVPCWGVRPSKEDQHPDYVLGITPIKGPQY
jgi:hypothetical protein